MDNKELIAKRVALELRPGNLVNLGIGLPQSVANYLPASVEVVLPIRERHHWDGSFARKRHGRSLFDRRRRPADRRRSRRLQLGQLYLLRPDPQRAPGRYCSRWPASRSTRAAG